MSNGGVGGGWLRRVIAAVVPTSTRHSDEIYPQIWYSRPYADVLAMSYTGYDLTPTSRLEHVQYTPMRSRLPDPPRNPRLIAKVVR